MQIRMGKRNTSSHLFHVKQKKIQTNGSSVSNLYKKEAHMRHVKHVKAYIVMRKKPIRIASFYTILRVNRDYTVLYAKYSGEPQLLQKKHTH